MPKAPKIPKPTKSESKATKPTPLPASRLYALDPVTKLDPKEICAMTVRFDYEGHGPTASILYVYFKGGAVLNFHFTGPNHEVRARLKLADLEALT